MADNTTEIQKLYVAYFNRPADPSGLQFWNTQMATNANFYQTISHAFSTSAEYQAAYGNKSTHDVVDSVYMNLFGRHAEAGATGIDFWVNALDKGLMTVDNAVTQIAAGAQGNDRVVFNGRVAVATSFTAHLDQPNEVKAYVGPTAAKMAIDFLASIHDLQSGAAAIDPSAIDNVISNIVNGSTSGFSAELVGVQSADAPTALHG
jgi:dihydropteroate synthase